MIDGPIVAVWKTASIGPGYVARNCSTAARTAGGAKFPSISPTSFTFGQAASRLL